MQDISRLEAVIHMDYIYLLKKNIPIYSVPLSSRYSQISETSNMEMIYYRDNILA
jgi:hypothetical protein